MDRLGKLPEIGNWRQDALASRSMRRGGTPGSGPRHPVKEIRGKTSQMASSTHPTNTI